MATEIYLGYPPEHIKNWIINYINNINPELPDQELIFESDFNVISAKLSLDLYMPPDINNVYEYNNDDIIDFDEIEFDSETIKTFNTQISDYLDYISKITISNYLDINDDLDDDIEEQIYLNPLCFTAEEPNAKLIFNKGYNDSNIVTSIDGINWISYTFGTEITLKNIGDKIYFSAKNENNISFNGYQFIISNGKIAASGNINTLIKSDGSIFDLTEKSNCYKNLFSDCTALTKAPELQATILADNCYNGMFKNCISLTTAPILSVTTLTYACYANMFLSCISLTKAPELPATNLANYCYSNMFNNCSMLTTPPSVLCSTVLTDSCYFGMFENCYSLTATPNIFAQNLANNCFSAMFKCCTSLKYGVFQNIEKRIIYNWSDTMFKDAANNIQITCKDGILEVNYSTN